MREPAVIKDAGTLCGKGDILEIIHGKENFRVKTGSLFHEIGNHFIRSHSSEGFKLVFRAVGAEVCGLVRLAFSHRIECGNEVALAF